MSQCYACKKDTEIREDYPDKHLVICSYCKPYFITEDAIRELEDKGIDVDKFRKYISTNTSNGEDYPTITSYDVELLYE